MNARTTVTVTRSLFSPQEMHLSEIFEQRLWSFYNRNFSFDFFYFNIFFYLNPNKFSQELKSSNIQRLDNKILVFGEISHSSWKEDKCCFIIDFFVKEANLYQVDFANNHCLINLNSHMVSPVFFSRLWQLHGNSRTQRKTFPAAL